MTATKARIDTLEAVHAVFGGLPSSKYNLRRKVEGVGSVTHKLKAIPESTSEDDVKAAAAEGMTTSFKVEDTHTVLGYTPGYSASTEGDMAVETLEKFAV